MRLKIKTVTAALTHLAFAGILTLAFLKAEPARNNDVPAKREPEKRTTVIAHGPHPITSPEIITDEDSHSHAAPEAAAGSPESATAPPAQQAAAPPPSGLAPPEMQNLMMEAGTNPTTALLDRLVKAYPDFLAGHDGQFIIWKDGTKMPFDDGKPKTPGERLELPDLEDQFLDPYPVGRTGLNPAKDFDPGRVRYEPFFQKMYGNCKKGEVEPRLAKVIWLRKHGGKAILITSVNGVAERLQQVSDELDNLPERFMRYLKPVAGIYNCRAIAGTGRMSMHAYAAAVDLNSEYGDHWQWAKTSKGLYVYHNSIPWEIVEIFEKHGFIWGGKWYHFDTLHFEYRPELLPEASQPASVSPSQQHASPADEKPGSSAAQGEPDEPAGPPLPLPERQPRKIP